MTGAGEHVFRAAALAALIGCMAVTGVAIAEGAVPGWDGTPLALGCVGAALEAYIAYRATRGGNLRATAAHAAVFLILAQLYVDALDGRQPVSGGVPYVTSTTFIYFLPLLLSWLAVTELMRTLAALERPPEEGFLDISPVRRLTARFFIAGTVLFLAAGLTQPGMARTFKLPHLGAGPPLLPVFAYFLIGIVFLGRLEYSALHRRWQVQRTQIAGGMAGRWTATVLAFTAGVAVLALLLPTSKTLGILGPGHDAWDQLVLLLRGPLTGLLSWFRPSATPRINIHLTPPPGFHLPPRRPKASHHGGGGGGSWFGLAQTLLFWTAALLLAGYLVRAYLRGVRGKRRLRRPRSPAGVWGAIGRIWAALVRRLRALVAGVADLLPDPVAARLTVSGALRRRGTEGGSVGGPARKQIIAYYRRMVRQAERRGVPRTAAQTPEELAAVLGPEIPQAAGDVALLTAAFVEARYSRHAIPPERVNPVRAGWERIRRALRHGRDEAQKPRAYDGYTR